MVAFTTNYRLTKPDFNAEGWDTQLNSDLDILDAVLGQFNTGLTIQGVWLNATLYPAGVSVVDGTTGHIWQNAVTHTSALTPSTFLADRTAHPSYWTDITNPAIGAAASAAAAVISANSAAASLAAITAVFSGGTTGTGAAVLATAPTITNITLAGASVFGGTISGAGLTSYLASPGAIGGTVPNTGAFTTLKGAIRGYLSGLTLSFSSTTVLAIAAGICTDSTNAVYIDSPTAFTKSTAGTWAAGTGGNGMGTGLTIANTTWYHVFAIIKSGLTDFYFDTSVTAANKPASTTAFRRIGSFKTNGSAQILNFIQTDDEFAWVTVPSAEVATGAITSSPTTVALAAVPLGLPVIAHLFGDMTHGSAGNTISLCSIGAGFIVAQSCQVGTLLNSFILDLPTNAAAQVAYQGGAATLTTMHLTVSGWRDTRGKML